MVVHGFEPSFIHADGEGSVEHAAAYKSFENRHAAENVWDFLEGLGYAKKEGYFLGPACTKFWFAYGIWLGSLVVYSAQLSTLAVHEVISQPTGSKSWKPYRENLAYFLPASGGNARSGSKAYGGILARAIFGVALSCCMIRRHGYLRHLGGLVILTT